MFSSLTLHASVVARSCSILVLEAESTPTAGPWSNQVDPILPREASLQLGPNRSQDSPCHDMSFNAKVLLMAFQSSKSLLLYATFRELRPPRARLCERTSPAALKHIVLLAASGSCISTSAMGVALVQRLWRQLADNRPLWRPRQEMCRAQRASIDEVQRATFELVVSFSAAAVG